MPDNKTRERGPAVAGDTDLGPFKDLPGTWVNVIEKEGQVINEILPGRGWNMIALPFSGGQKNYRLLVNQYNETLKFEVIDKNVANRGISNDKSTQTDQFITALEYDQHVVQIASDDFPPSENKPTNNKPIHHEPGLFLHIQDNTTNELNIARSASIPHGDSVMALGRSSKKAGAPVIPDIDGFPVVAISKNDPYLAPYNHYKNKKFTGVLHEGGFDPTLPNELLKEANFGFDILETTQLDFDTTLASGSITNIPFIVQQANATRMQATFWILKVRNQTTGEEKLRLQYSQTVFLDFFERSEFNPKETGLISWPHVSINTLEKVE